MKKERLIWTEGKLLIRNQNGGECGGVGGRDGAGDTGSREGHLGKGTQTGVKEAHVYDSSQKRLPIVIIISLSS